ncbi:sodium:solute symporter family protein [Rubellicoccus peritrichatus]|uniref:Sodium:solute symporter n=1 Tax=Rubellicoccus peritrichatus TaxID=3080537 RepID=A0AAQ3L646_9BACT|nr:hypothetical protein [Puniceicoccus sp. CR14]WOO39621.1 hypothetical protein RZN69_13435 [Puniceicoccus sp. CR14]
MATIDWIIVVSFLLVLTTVAVRLRSYTTTVSDFLAANRCAKRYLLTAAEGAAGIGAISVVALFEVYHSAGFTPAYWELVLVPMWLVLALSGWIIYRFRQTRCLTMAQFLEVRYNRSFRVLSGFVAFIAGIVNYGIFPAVSSRFFIYSMNLPTELSILGLEVPTFALLMACMLSLALLITLCGGQIAIIVTDFIQGQLINIVFVIASIAVLMAFSWGEISDALKVAAEGASRINPFDTARAETFSFWFYLMFLFMRFYTYMCWQGTQGYNASAKNAHEARMSKIVAQWRVAVGALIPMLFAVCAYVLLTQTQFAGSAQLIQDELATIQDSQIQTQMTTPIALQYLLPIGVFGLFIAVMLAATISTDSTYLHSWGSVFLQDVVMPFRKKPFPPKLHLTLLRISIVGVAIFAFFFSLLFRQTEYIILFFQLTGALFASGAGTCIIGGLYWRKGTAAAAWSAMSTGVLLVIAGFILSRVDPEFPLNYMQIVFVTQLCSILVYMLVSLVTCKEELFDLERMLHRGKYAVSTDQIQGVTSSPSEGSALAVWLNRRLGINADFNRTDRMMYYATALLCVIMLITFFGLIVWNFTIRPSENEWLGFWLIFIYVSLAIASISTLWILIGGVSNLRDLLYDLKHMARDDSDDGFVVSKQEPSQAEAKEPGTN